MSPGGLCGGDVFISGDWNWARQIRKYFEVLPEGVEQSGLYLEETLLQLSSGCVARANSMAITAQAIDGFVANVRRDFIQKLIAALETSFKSGAGPPSRDGFLTAVEQLTAFPQTLLYWTCTQLNLRPFLPEGVFPQEPVMGEVYRAFGVQDKTSETFRAICEIARVPFIQNFDREHIKRLCFWVGPAALTFEKTKDLWEPASPADPVLHRRPFLPADDAETLLSHPAVPCGTFLLRLSSRRWPDQWAGAIVASVKLEEAAPDGSLPALIEHMNVRIMEGFGFESTRDIVHHLLMVPSKFKYLFAYKSPVEEDDPAHPLTATFVSENDTHDYLLSRGSEGKREHTLKSLAWRIANAVVAATSGLPPHAIFPVRHRALVDIRDRFVEKVIGSMKDEDFDEPVEQTRSSEVQQIRALPDVVAILSAMLLQLGRTFTKTGPWPRFGVIEETYRMFGFTDVTDGKFKDILNIVGLPYTEFYDVEQIRQLCYYVAPVSLTYQKTKVLWDICPSSTVVGRFLITNSASETLLQMPCPPGSFFPRISDEPWPQRAAGSILVSWKTGDGPLDIAHTPLGWFDSAKQAVAALAPHAHLYTNLIQ